MLPCRGAKMLLRFVVAQQVDLVVRRKDGKVESVAR